MKSEIQVHVGNADNKLQKLDRIFNYLMQEPGPRKNEVVARMIAETYRKVQMMRKSPSVCFQIDAMENMTKWRSGTKIMTVQAQTQ